MVHLLRCLVVVVTVAHGRRMRTPFQAHTTISTGARTNLGKLRVTSGNHGTSSPSMNLQHVSQVDRGLESTGQKMQPKMRTWSSKWDTAQTNLSTRSRRTTAKLAHILPAASRRLPGASFRETQTLRSLLSAGRRVVSASGLRAALPCNTGPRCALAVLGPGVDLDDVPSDVQRALVGGGYRLMSPAELRATREFADVANDPQPGSWLLEPLSLTLGFLFLLAAALTFVDLVKTVNPVLDNIPEGRLQTLSDYLKCQQQQQRPKTVGNYLGRAPPKSSDMPEPGMVETILLEPVQSVQELWAVFSWASFQILAEVPSMVLERNFLFELAAQAAYFPNIYSEWKQYEGCAIEEVNGSDSQVGQVPIDRDSLTTRELVLKCGEMVDNFGLTVVARDPREPRTIVGTITLRAKRLPEGCHVESVDDDDSAVVCNVVEDAVYESGALEAVGYLQTIAVGLPWRRSGLSDKLLRFSEDKVRSWGLELVALHVHRDNWSALYFYKNRGFEITTDWMGWGDKYFLLIKPL